MEHITGNQNATYLTYSEASILLGVKKGTLYCWVSRREIPFVRIGRRTVRFRRTDLDEWLRSRSVVPVWREQPEQPNRETSDRRGTL